MIFAGGVVRGDVDSTKSFQSVLVGFAYGLRLLCGQLLCVYSFTTGILRGVGAVLPLGGEAPTPPPTRINVAKYCTLLCQASLRDYFTF
jgi:hypothetical protein